MEQPTPSPGGPLGLSLCCGAGAGILCCAAPVIAAAVGAAGLAAWLRGADVVLVPLVAVSAGAIAYFVARRRRAPAADPS